MTLNLTEAPVGGACRVPTHRGPCVMTAGHAERTHRAVPRMPLEYARARAFERGQSPARPQPDPLSDLALPCRSMDPELFFPIGTAAADPVALAACAACPARNACLDRALELDETGPDSGIWGGTTHLERRRRLLRLAGAA